MSALFVLAAALPALVWNQGAETASKLKEAGIERIYVPGASVAAWRAAGFDAADAAALSKYTRIEAPGVEWKIEVASATHMPWVDSNAWRYLRKPDGKFVVAAKAGSAALAAAEAYAYGADVAIEAAQSDLAPLGRMLAFIRKADRPPLPAVADIGLVDDGSDVAGEVMNLMVRRNLLFVRVRQESAAYQMTIRLGSPEFPVEAARDPAAFATKVRQRLTDEKRAVRIFGANVVIARLTEDASKARLHLINYGQRRLEGVRVRVRGAFSKGTYAAAGVDGVQLADYSVEDGATEFTVPRMGAYAIVDLAR